MMEDMLGMPNAKVEEVRTLLQECHKHSCLPDFSITVFDSEWDQWEDNLDDCCLTDEGMVLVAMCWDGGFDEIEDEISISDLLESENPKALLAEWIDDFLDAVPELRAYLNEATGA